MDKTTLEAAGGKQRIAVLRSGLGLVESALGRRRAFGGEPRDDVLRRWSGDRQSALDVLERATAALKEPGSAKRFAPLLDMISALFVRWSDRLAKWDAAAPSAPVVARVELGGELEAEEGDDDDGLPHLPPEMR